jgi:hypothetical protein
MMDYVLKYHVDVHGVMLWLVVGMKILLHDLLLVRYVLILRVYTIKKRHTKLHRMTIVYIQWHCVGHDLSVKPSAVIACCVDQELLAGTATSAYGCSRLVHWYAHTYVDPTSYTQVVQRLSAILERHQLQVERGQLSTNTDSQSPKQTSGRSSANKRRTSDTSAQSQSQSAGSRSTSMNNNSSTNNYYSGPMR